MLHIYTWCFVQRQRQKLALALMLRKTPTRLQTRASYRQGWHFCPSCPLSHLTPRQADLSHGFPEPRDDLHHAPCLHPRRELRGKNKHGKKGRVCVCKLNPLTTAVCRNINVTQIRSVLSLRRECSPERVRLEKTKNMKPEYKKNTKKKNKNHEKKM